jgi:hypothetical protein
MDRGADARAGGRSDRTAEKLASMKKVPQNRTIVRSTP